MFLCHVYDAFNAKYDENQNVAIVQPEIMWSMIFKIMRRFCCNWCDSQQFEEMLEFMK